MNPTLLLGDCAEKMRDHIFVRCEDCRNHGRCKKERIAFKCYHIKGCFVEVEKPKR